jgi:hypothetical protein
MHRSFALDYAEFEDGWLRRNAVGRLRRKRLRRERYSQDEREHTSAKDRHGKGFLSGRIRAAGLITLLP